MLIRLSLLQRKLPVDPKAMQQINFSENLEHAAGARIFVILEEVKETIGDFYEFMLCNVIYSYGYIKVCIKKSATGVTLRFSSDVIGTDKKFTDAVG